MVLPSIQIYVYITLHYGNNNIISKKNIIVYPVIQDEQH